MVIAISLELFNVKRLKGIIHSRILPAIKAFPKDPWHHNASIVYQHQLHFNH